MQPCQELDRIDFTKPLSFEDFCESKRQYYKEFAECCVNNQPPTCPFYHAVKAPWDYSCDFCARRIFKGLACPECTGGILGLCQDCIQRLGQKASPDPDGDPDRALQSFFFSRHCRSIGNFEAGEQHLQLALRIKRAVAGDAPDRLELVILLELGKLQKEWGNLEAAERYLREGLTVARSLPTDALNGSVTVLLHELAVLQKQSEAETAEQRLADATAP